MRLKEALISGIERLTAAHVGSPRMNAEVLLMFTLSCDRTHLYAYPEREFTPEEFTRYDEALSQRAHGVPSQYITGHQEFWGMDLVVAPAVLIPRPETEHLIETVVPLAKKIHNPRIVDVGTGGRIHFHQADLLAGFRDAEFDFVVSNPPYVGESEADQVQLEVRKFEPRSAVFAGLTGLEVIQRLVPQAHAILKPGGWLVMEISGTIVEGVRWTLSGWKDVKIIDDLQGIPRVALARKNPD